MEDFKKTPLWDNKLSVEERLDYLVKELTLEEKIQCLTTGCPDMERLGIKSFYLGGEAAHGIEARHDQTFNAGEPEPTTSFTQPIGMSGSFDRELIKECGKAVGEEARALYTRNGGGGLCRWAPTIDMERDPRWGRTEEAYGEDPYLTGEMASAYIQGMRGNHPFYLQCGATLKHFYANNVEKDRIKISSSLDERNKYEYYLEPFRKAIEEGGAEAVMTSYNEINGVPAIVNGEVQRLLKDTYGLPGHVVCDGGDFSQTVNDHHYFDSHAETIAYGLKAGVDCFTDDGKVVFAAAREALERGLITEEDIDKSIRNSFRTRIRLGLYDGAGECPYTGMGEEFINNREHQQTSRKMAEETVVLLKNEKSILPIREDEVSKLAVVGPLADVWYKDWYCGIPPYSVTVLEGIRNTYQNAEISYHSGLSKIRLKCGGKYIGLGKDGRARLVEKEQAETFLFTDWGCGSMTLQTEKDGLFLTLEEDTDVVKAGKKEAFAWFIRESWNLKPLKRAAEAIVEKAADGQLYKLESWDCRTVMADKDGYLTVEGKEKKTGECEEKNVEREEKISEPCKEKCEAVELRVEIVENGIEEAAAVAKEAEKVIVVLGSNPVINSKEEVDRTTLALPPAQQEMTDRILEVNPNAVVVLVTNYPYAITKLQESVPAILYSASGSQELGNGIAAVLSGKTSPAGRLPMTWYKVDEDLPDMEDYDIIKGGRTYQYFEKEVLYPFGYGLSYTEFAYGEMELTEEKEAVKLHVPVTNVGACTGDEVVQIYVHKESSRVKQPVCQLKAFERIKDLAPKETRLVEFVIKYEDLKYYDVISGEMLLEESAYTFMAGASSKDIRQKKTVFVSGGKAPDRNPFERTKAVQYDDYENCFVHRGTKGHTPDGSTCMIPGKAGDAPDSISDGEKIQGSLEYRDFVFEKQPSEVVLKACGVEDGKIRLFCTEQGEKECTVAIEQDADKEFTEVKAVLPENFAELKKAQTLRIVIEGKIKIAEFLFR